MWLKNISNYWMDRDYKSGTDIQVLLSMNRNHFGDPLTFNLVATSDQNISNKPNLDGDHCKHDTCLASAC